MYVTPASFDSFGRKLTHAAAERLSRNWKNLLLNGLLLILAGVLIFSIDWSVRSLATFIGALFILEGFWAMLTTGIDSRAANFVTGLLSAFAARQVLRDWWVLLMLGVAEVPLGVFALPDSTGRRLPDLIDNVRYLEVDKGPHNIGWRHAEEVNAALLGFIATGEPEAVGEAATVVA
jgi:pimeloyl-ACP methyl ester carboxylesterase